MTEAKAQADQCTCITCATCKGTGQVRVWSDGYPEWDLETCYDCDGEGISGVCYACQYDDEDGWNGF